MVKIYKITSDVTSYRRLLPSLPGDAMKCVFDGKTKMGWNPIEFYVSNPINPKGSFSSVTGCSFAIDSRLLGDERISNMLAICSELLPIKTENGDDLHIVNVTQCLSVLDVGKTVRDKSWDSVRQVPAPGRIVKYEFHANRLNHSPLFKIPEEINCSIFTHTGTQAPEDDFYAIYHQLGLTGLKFEKVWEGC